ncbi:hypothetical protein IGI04_026108 [Brassica rapa subsp. trilocularis]|uniref:Growth-regulating factor n=1 Tax=Brassica rapa subsp. trilocularis TaxID=1813537 RepID=A0ABQ7KXM0_BRACM|nr:hypothetical protein IGI04_026108 [Brassica rapa subsp. trilocularis]
MGNQRNIWWLRVSNIAHADVKKVICDEAIQVEVPIIRCGPTTRNGAKVIREGFFKAVQEILDQDKETGQNQLLIEEMVQLNIQDQAGPIEVQDQADPIQFRSLSQNRTGLIISPSNPSSTSTPIQSGSADFLYLFMTTRIHFTESQWEELENQALVFKYIAANIPVPPHLLFLIRRPFLFSSSAYSSSPNFFSPHFGWNVYEMGKERKMDAEPGRCRRTDGKKWRCSKDASPDSKYCERHMHRGKNRSSRKPLPPPPQFYVPSTPSIFLDFSLSSSRAKSKRTGYMNDFFSIEPSGSIKSCSGLAMEGDGGSSKYESLKQREKQTDRSCFILGTELGTLERPLMLEAKQKQRDDKDYEEEEQRSKRFYKFLDEWPSSKSSGSTSLFI